MTGNPKASMASVNEVLDKIPDKKHLYPLLPCVYLTLRDFIGEMIGYELSDPSRGFLHGLFAVATIHLVFVIIFLCKNSIINNAQIKLY